MSLEKDVVTDINAHVRCYYLFAEFDEDGVISYFFISTSNKQSCCDGSSLFGPIATNESLETLRKALLDGNLDRVRFEDFNDNGLYDCNKLKQQTLVEAKSYLSSRVSSMNEHELHDHWKQQGASTNNKRTLSETSDVGQVDGKAYLSERGVDTSKLTYLEIIFETERRMRIERYMEDNYVMHGKIVSACLRGEKYEHYLYYERIGVGTGKDFVEINYTSHPDGLAVRAWCYIPVTLSLPYPVNTKTENPVKFKLRNMEKPVVLKITMEGSELHITPY